MKLLAITAGAYVLCLLLAFPGYFHPLTPHHNDFYFPPGLSFDGHSLLEKLAWPRPLGFIAFQILGKLGLQGYLFFVACIALANAALMITLAGRILGRRVSWIAALTYCALLFAHPDFYVDYLHDAYATLSLFYLLLAMHAWHQFRESGRSRYVVMCGTLMLLLAFTKETYFISALCLWGFEAILRRKKERELAVVLFGASLALFLISAATNAYSLKTVVRLETGAAAPYHLSFAPAAFLEGVFFYFSHLFPLIALLAVAAALALARERRAEALALSVAGFCAIFPHALLPNHTDSMYSWTAATLSFAPILFVPRPSRSAVATTQAVSAAVLVFTFIWMNRTRYNAHRWTMDQEKINRKILAAYPSLKAIPGGTKTILITGLSMPFHPFYTSSYVRAEFGPGPTWTVLVPRGQPIKFESPVQLAKPDAINPAGYDYAFGFGEDGNLIFQKTHAELQMAASGEQRDRVLYPALNGILDKNNKWSGEWLPLLRAGEIYWQWGQLESAAVCLRRSAELEGGHNPYPFFFLGQVNEDRGRLAEAGQYYAKAVALSGDQPNPAFSEALNRVQGK